MNKLRISSRDENHKRIVLTIQEYITLGFFKSLFSKRKEDVVREFQVKVGKVNKKPSTSAITYYPAGSQVYEAATLNLIYAEVINKTSP